MFNAHAKISWKQTTDRYGDKAKSVVVSVSKLTFGDLNRVELTTGGEKIPPCVVREVVHLAESAAVFTSATVIADCNIVVTVSMVDLTQV